MWKNLFTASWSVFAYIVGTKNVMWFNQHICLTLWIHVSAHILIKIFHKSIDAKKYFLNIFQGNYLYNKY